MKANLTAFASGLLFAFGLVLSGMSAPGNIIGFLDVFGDWNSSLVFVLGAAVITYFVAFRVIRRKQEPLLTAKFQLPTKTSLDGRLIAGAAIFGTGWGLSGYCPAPALTALTSGKLTPVIFIAALVGGFYLYDLFENVSSRRNVAQKT